MCRNLKRLSILIVIVLAVSVFSGIGFTGEAWKFGVVPDTQWKPYDGENNGVAIHIIDAVVREMIRHKVELVVHVGDVCDKSSPQAFATCAAHFRPLSEHGIGFYPVRGNHDSQYLGTSREFAQAFPGLPGTPGCQGSSPNLPLIAGLTYAFVHKNAKFVMLDSFPVDDGTEEGITYTPADYQDWIDAELEAEDHEHAFVVAHKNLIGQSHKDNIFTTKKEHDANPEMQNAFFRSLQENGVRYFLSGHDHMYYRSTIFSPNGLWEVMQIICGSCCHKFYAPKEPFTPRDLPAAQDLQRVSFLIFTVDDDKVTAECYSTEPFGAEPASPCWTLRETFGHTLDGETFEDQKVNLKKFKRFVTVP